MTVLLFSTRLSLPPEICAPPSLRRCRDPRVYLRLVVHQVLRHRIRRQRQIRAGRHLHIAQRTLNHRYSRRARRL
jgi:hypothetical protein